MADPINATSAIEEDLNSVKKNIDMLFLIAMGLLVYLLQPGFAFFDSACVRPKNVTSALFRNYADMCISIFCYFLTGYALSFGNGNSFWGTDYFALVGLPDDQLANLFYQYTFAACAATIPSGVVHERCSLTAYTCYTALVSGFIYPMACHWAEATNGWLNVLGFEDFAFSGVVHALGGAASLAACYMAGPRIGHFNSDGTVNEMPVHSIPQATLSGFLFWAAIIGFNAGSQGTISNIGDGPAMSKVVLNTIICIMACSLTGVFHDRFVAVRSANGWSYNGGMAGSFIGMVVICAGCNVMSYWASLVTGILTFYAYVCVRILVLKMKVDDVVDGISIHLSAGYFGLLSVPLFRPDGIVYGPSKANAYALLINALGGIVIIVWSGSTTILLYVVLRYFNLHRVSEQDEKIGLDISVHNEIAYNYVDVVAREEPAETIVSPRFRRLNTLRSRISWKAENLGSVTELN